MKNFYPDQYQRDKKFEISHNYLSKQFDDYKDIFKKIERVILENDFTRGNSVNEVEELIANECGTKYAIAVGSGTDAIMLSLKSLGIKEAFKNAHYYVNKAIITSPRFGNGHGPINHSFNIN